MTYVGLQLDSAKPASIFFIDPNVRKALMLALDRDALLQTARARRNRRGWRATAALMGIHAVDPKYRQNIDEAKRLLDAAGWKLGPMAFGSRITRPSPSRLHEFQRSGSRDLCGPASRCVGKVGINATVVAEKWAAFVDRVTRRMTSMPSSPVTRATVDPDLAPLLD